MTIETFTGQNLIDFIESNNVFKLSPINNLLVELLKRNIIHPSDIINAYSDLMQHKLMVVESHYNDACTTALQMESGNFKKEEDKKEMLDRFLYNASFSKSFPNLIGRTMSEDDKKKWSDFWVKTYGFRPETEE